MPQRSLIEELRELQQRQRKTIREAMPVKVGPPASLRSDVGPHGATELQVRLVVRDLLADHEEFLEELELHQARAAVATLAAKTLPLVPQWMDGAAPSIAERVRTEVRLTELNDHKPEDRELAKDLRNAVALLDVADQMAEPSEPE